MVLLLQSNKTEKKKDSILEEILKLNHKFSQLESENVLIEQANFFLSKRLVDMERQC